MGGRDFWSSRRVNKSATGARVDDWGLRDMRAEITRVYPAVICRIARCLHEESRMFGFSSAASLATRGFAPKMRDYMLRYVRTLQP